MGSQWPLGRRPGGGGVGRRLAGNAAGSVDQAILRRGVANEIENFELVLSPARSGATGTERLRVQVEFVQAFRS